MLKSAAKILKPAYENCNKQLQILIKISENITKSHQSKGIIKDQNKNRQPGVVMK